MGYQDFPWRRGGSRSFEKLVSLSLPARLSAIHYAQDQQALIDQFMTRLHPDDLLVVELGIAPGEEDAFIPVKRNMTTGVSDVRLFPTRPKMKSMLSEYSHTFMGHSVMQRGDPTPCCVYHIMHKKP